MSRMLQPAAPKPASEPFLRLEQLAAIGNAAEAQQLIKTALVRYLGQCPYLTDKHFEVFRVVAASPCCDDPALSVLSQMMQRQAPSAAIETLLSLIRTECGKVGPEAREEQSFLYLQLLSFIFATGLFAKRSAAVLNDRASFAVRTLISLRQAHLAGDSDALDALASSLTNLPDRIEGSVAPETIRERLRSDEALLSYLGIPEIASLLAQLRKGLPRFELWEKSAIHAELLNFFKDEEIPKKRIPLFPCIFQTVLDTFEWMEWSDTRLPVYPNLLYTADKRYSQAMCFTVRAAFMRCISSNTQQERSEESFNRYAAGINEELTCDQKRVLVNDMLREQTDRRDIFWWLHFRSLYQSGKGEQADPQVLEFLEFAVREENRVPTVLRHMERPLFWNWAVSKKDRSLIKVPDLLIPGWAKRLANKKFGELKKIVTFAIPIGNNPVTYCGNSSVGRAQPCQGWGREFESRFPL